MIDPGFGMYLKYKEHPVHQTELRLRTYLVKLEPDKFSSDSVLRKSPKFLLDFFP